MSGKWSGLLLLCLAIAIGLPTLAATHAVNISAQLEVRKRLVPGASVAFPMTLGVKQPDDLREDIRIEIGEWLKDRGFVLTSVDDADLYVAFEFGSTKEPPSLRQDRPGGAYTPPSGVFNPPRQEYTHYFVVAVTDAEVFRQTAETKVVWRGQAVLADRGTKTPGGKSDERALMILDLLRVAAFEFFGQTQESHTGYYPEPKTKETPTP